MSEPLDIRTVFLTTKTDSHLHRGRMGRGFKEMLCLALHAEVRSGDKAVLFIIEHGRRVTRQVPLKETMRGTFVQMSMPWSQEVIQHLEEYFQTLLVPVGVHLTMNGRKVQPRQVAHSIQATLPTELFEAGRWIKPERRTSIELVAVGDGEDPAVYEMGIPVCDVGWTAPYHANVLQRIPMNPCRDAVASGYLQKLHRVCLPILLPEMNDEQVREDWVGVAVSHCPEPVQKEVIRLAFGENLARSVPKMGARQFDEDARDLGVQVIDTRQTSGGFRQVLQEHVLTSRDVVNQHDRNLLEAAAATHFSLDDVQRGDAQLVKRRQTLIEAAGGKDRVQKVMEFARWFCQKLLDGYGDASICSVGLAMLKPVDAVATWSQDDVLTLGLDTPWLWSDPLGEETLVTLIHETAHARNAHHGRDFHKEMEALAGRAARIMFIHSELIQHEYASLLESGH
jgi:hypothetical protein